MTKNINNSSLEAFPFGILQGKILLENDVLIDIDVLNVNLEMCKIVDLPREQIINCKLSNVDNIFLNQLFTKIKNDANRLLNNGIIEFYLTDIHSDLLYRISARLSSSDEISLILNPTYINDSKMDLQELELRYSRHEIIAGLNKTIYWEVNNEGLYTSVTNGVEKVLGYKPDELINKKYFYDLFPDNVREEYKVIGFGIINSKKILHGFD